VPISEVAEVNPGLPKTTDLMPESLVSFLPMASVSEAGNIITQDERQYCEVAKGYTYFANGDVLMAKITPCMENGKATFVQGLKHPAGFGSTEFHVLRPGSEIDGKYLFYMIWNPAFRRVAERNMTGTAGQKRVPSGFLKDSKIPLPPLPEQKRIAAILDKADSIRRKRQETVRLTEELLRSVFLEMFGDPVTNPKGWETRAFVKVCESRLGKMLDANQQTGEHLRPYLRNSNVQWDRIETSDLEQMDFNERDRKTFALQNGDVLICEGGEVGRAAIWRNQLMECYFQKAIHRARPNQDLVLPEYVMFWLWFMAKNGGFKDHVTSATIAHLTGEKLKEIQMALPPITLQKQFLRAYNLLAKLKTSTYIHQAETDALFNTLVRSSFKGGL
jgi:type I restriction enzyme S subunit